MGEWRRGGYAAVGVAVLAGTTWLVLHRAQPAAPAAAPTGTGTARVTRTDVVVRDMVSGTNAYLDQAVVAAAGPGTLTWLPAVGTVVAADQRLYEVDGQPVVLWTGARPAWRDFASGMTDGPDVAQLERCLTQLGYGAGLTVDNHFSSATATAIRRWQAAHGLATTGVIRLGTVVFRPGPVRVAAVTAPLGAPSSPGQPILTVTSTATAVTVNLDPTLQNAVHPGDPVSVSLPGGTGTTPGHVSTVGAPVASVAGNGGGAAGSAQGGQNAAATLTVPVTIDLDTPSGGSGPGIGPVQVAITTAVDRAVLAVPIDALLAAPGGGFQVAVRDSAGRRLVKVQTRLFDESDGLVEVQGLAQGTVVEVPQT